MKKIIILITVALTFCIGYIVWQYYIFHIAYDQMPQLSCHHLATSYWQRAKRLSEKSVHKDQKFIERYSTISSDIFALCNLDFTDDQKFTDYYAQSSTPFQITNTNFHYIVSVSDDNNKNGFYHIRLLDNYPEYHMQKDEQFVIGVSPVDLEKYKGKQVYIDAEFATTNGTSHPCRLGWEDWCKRQNTNYRSLIISQIMRAQP